MIDAPVSVYIEYKNLSPHVAQAEYQKDLIASAIKKIEGQTKLILEYSSDRQVLQSQTPPFFFEEAKCVVCYNIDPDTNGVVLSSVQKIVKNNGKNSELTFDIKDFLGRTFSWKIELSEVKPIVVHTGKSVKINFVSGNGIFIQSYGKSLKDAALGDMIRVQINSWFKKNNNLNSTEIIEAKVVAPNEVEYVDKQ